MSTSDPTDEVLAAIASILDQPEPRPEPEEIAAVSKAAVPASIEAEGYSKTGPGPMEAVRFKWTVRRENDEYYVDETLGENSKPVVTGPLTEEAAIRLVDDRESDARRRFDLLKRQMIGQAASPKT